MKNRLIAMAAAAILATGSLLAQQQPTPDELQQRLQALEKKVADLQQSGTNVEELKHEIDVLSQEIEKLKVEREKPEATTEGSTYGLEGAASKVYRSGPGVSLGGYGEFLYQNFAGKNDAGQRVDATDSADFLRAVLYTGYKFNDKVIFNSEMEVEHGSTEHGGEVSMEFGYLDFLQRPAFNVRAGVVLMPVGLVNEMHEPTAFLSARRPEIEHDIIPATWSEFGVGAFGDVGSFSYRTYLTTGLNSEEFDSEEGIREGRGAGAEAKAEDLAWVGRLDWHPIEGTLFGGSLYTGNSAQGRTTPDGTSFNGRVTLAELHADAKVRGAMLRALWTRGTIGDAAAINAANGLEGDEGVGKSFGGWYAEAGYDLTTIWKRGESSVVPFVRYESLDTQKEVPAGYQRNPEMKRSVWTLGVSWKPIPQTVIKADWQNFSNDAHDATDQFNIALGYIF